MARQKKLKAPTPEEFKNLIIEIKDSYRGGDFVTLKIKILDAMIDLLRKLGYDKAMDEFEDDDFYTEFD